MTAPDAGIAEAYSQIQAAGAGTKVRTLQYEILQPDDSRSTVDMQVVVLADELGKALGTQWAPLHVDSERLGGKIDDLCAEIRRLRMVMEHYTGIKGE
jgi:hypothetical protein